ncbi:MAG TPA: hypothetical protein VJ806_15605 [Luteimonas sp.]|nr:hypothetical protein [Luteimonas sp.]
MADDDLDRALGLGLLEADPCPGCEASCAKALADAREARMRALAARERYRARDARLQRRAEELKAKRAAAADGPKSRALPAAAAAALARAKAKAVGNPSQ